MQNQDALSGMHTQHCITSYWHAIKAGAIYDYCTHTGKVFPTHTKHECRIATDGSSLTRMQQGAEVHEWLTCPQIIVFTFLIIILCYTAIELTSCCQFPVGLLHVQYLDSCVLLQCGPGA